MMRRFGAGTSNAQYVTWKLAGSLVAAFLLLVARARADVKVVRDVTVDQTGAPVAHRVVTTYFLADRARVEFDGGPIYLLDFRMRRAFQLDVLHQSYSLLTIEQALMPSTTAEDIKQKLERTREPTVQVDVAPAKATSPREAGQAYHVQASVLLPPPTGIGGLDRARGNRQGGSAVYANSSIHKERPSSMAVDGDYNAPATSTALDPDWLSLDVALSLPDDPRFLPLIDPLVRALHEAHVGLLLSSRIRVRSIFETGRSTTPAVRDTVTVTVATRSISHAGLDRTLFYVPSGYRLDADE